MSKLPRLAFLPLSAIALLAAAAESRAAVSAAGDPARAGLPLTSAATAPESAATETAPAPRSDPLAEFPLSEWLRPEMLGPGRAQEVAGAYDDNLYRTFTLSLGAAAYAKFNTDFQISGDASVGADIDGEKLLGLEESSLVIRFDANYAFNRRHWVMLSYYDINRDGERTIPNDIVIGNVTIPASRVETKFDTGIIKLGYRYNFVTDERTVIGASFGFHVMRIDTSIKSQQFAVQEDFKVSAPLPVIGLHGAYALGRKWKLGASAEVLQFDLGDYRGAVTDTRLTVEHDMFDHFGWGIGFNGFQVDAKIEGHSGLTGELEYGYQGLMLFARMMF